MIIPAFLPPGLEWLLPLVLALALPVGITIGTILTAIAYTAAAAGTVAAAYQEAKAIQAALEGQDYRPAGINPKAHLEVLKAGAIGGVSGGIGAAAGPAVAGLASNLATGATDAGAAAPGALGATGTAVAAGAPQPAGAAAAPLNLADTIDVASQLAQDTGASVAKTAGGFGEPAGAAADYARQAANVARPLTGGETFARGALTGVFQGAAGQASTLNPRRIALGAAGGLAGGIAGPAVSQVAGPVAGQVAGRTIGGGVTGLGDEQNSYGSALQGATSGAISGAFGQTFGAFEPPPEPEPYMGAQFMGRQNYVSAPGPGDLQHDLDLYLGTSRGMETGFAAPVPPMAPPPSISRIPAPTMGRALGVAGMRAAQPIVAGAAGSTFGRYLQRQHQPVIMPGTAGPQLYSQLRRYA